MIESRKLSIKKNGNEILSDISTAIREGEILGIIGRAGSGKSMFLRCLCADEWNFQGEVLINRRPVRSFGKKLLHKTISCSHHYKPGYLDDTVYDYLIMSRTPFKKLFNPFGEEDRLITEEYMEQFDLTEYQTTPLRYCTSDVMARIILAFAFIRKAPVLLLDNPTCNLSISSLSRLQRSIMRYVINGENQCVIVSHDLNFITQTADRILVFDNGMIAEDLNPGEITADIFQQYFNTEVFISRNIYNGKPSIHLYTES